MSEAFARPRIEDFLYKEARLLDEWRLTEWAGLFTDDGEYLVPATDAPDGDPSKTQFLIYDDHHRLHARAKRLLSREAHAEFPHSRTRRLIGNVEIEPTAADSARVRCNFVLYRSRLAKTDVFPGHGVYDLIADAEGRLRIRRKRSVLDTDTLRGQGKISVIL
ncbi:MAG: aromatic-ring-hydroxylating dioxygenase subunit beta [Hyphomonadaceae bacterium]